ncbi:MAG TPA: hypothetical protein ENH94_11900 [Phycisphaerales bacterium]|nr:hypothetical protein [Phycisphaerales bacterium]
MKTSDFNLQSHAESTVVPLDIANRFASMEQEPGDDELLECISSTPVGKLLRMISTLPEIRQEKVCSARMQIANGDYDLGPNLDEALDRVLEEFIAEG